MTDNYKFSAILPIYKGVNFHTFKKPFESIINQTLKPNELLVIFDGPVKSNIRELIKEYQGKYNFIKNLVITIRIKKSFDLHTISIKPFIN